MATRVESVLDIQFVRLGKPRTIERHAEPRAVGHPHRTVADHRCIDGQSGSGKSTIAQAIMNLLAPNAEVTGGRVEEEYTRMLIEAVPAFTA